MFAYRRKICQDEANWNNWGAVIILVRLLVSCIVCCLCLLTTLVSKASTTASFTPPAKITVGLSADYPPFEYKTNGVLQGLDVELIRKIAAELKIAEVTFVDLDYNALLPALSSGHIDAAISAIAITPERKKNVDFTVEYYHTDLYVISSNQHKFSSEAQLVQQRIGAQLGSTMEKFAKAIPQATVIGLTNHIQLIQELKIGRIQAVICEKSQALAFMREHPELYAHPLQTAQHSYAIALKKHSPLTQAFSEVILRLQRNGELTKLQQHWIK
jgi:ABC-type amino acid transport substrate-binding protein